MCWVGVKHSQGAALTALRTVYTETQKNPAPDFGMQHGLSNPTQRRWDFLFCCASLQPMYLKYFDTVCCSLKILFRRKVM
jgi:hypothetical protein